jgi:hypothetical protein
MLNNPIIYIQIHRGHFIARRLDHSGSVRKESPALSHPRTLMGDFSAIESLFRSAVKELTPGWLLRPRLKILVHLVPEAEGGYTNVEQRAFQEAAVTAGARACKVVLGVQPLSDDQVAKAFR